MENETLLARRRAGVTLTIVGLWGAVLWSIHALGWLMEDPLYWLGIYPRTAKGAIGIALYPFIHSSWGHLASNSAGILTVGGLLFFFYPKSAWQAVIAAWVGSGVMIWSIGSSGYHVGASGIIYGMAFFTVTRGLMLHQRTLWAISLLVIFLYGSLIWGLLPGYPGISWEGHLGGALSGLLTALMLEVDNPNPYRELSDRVGPFTYSIHHTGGRNLRIAWRRNGQRRRLLPR